MKKKFHGCLEACLDFMKVTPKMVDKVSFRSENQSFQAVLGKI